MKKTLKWQFLLLLLTVCAYGCNNEAESEEIPPHDPSREVRISGFTPESGGALQQLLIMGENFGNDKSKVEVTIGGQKAVVLSVNGTNLYCYVPTKAYSGEIVLLIGDPPLPSQIDTRQRCVAEKKFEYRSEMVVSTLCGYRNKDDDQGWKTGGFDTCAGFRNDSFLAFDPQDKDHLYISYDVGDGSFGYIQLIDLKDETVTNAINTSQFDVRGSKRVRSIDFSLELPAYNKPAGQYMIVSFDVDFDGIQTPSVFLVERNSDGTFDDRSPVTLLASYRQCNGATVHPNGEIYFNSYERGQLFRLDLNDYLADPTSWEPRAMTNPKIEQLYTIADPSWEFKVFIHPTGTYAYLVVINQHYIMRTDYNATTKRFATPYIVAGHYKQAGYGEGIGTAAWFNRPYQGVFVKNDEYPATGDQYDFYFAEFSNHCVSKLTPDGVVETFAGRGSNGFASDGNLWGADDGALRTMARFRDPSGMTYDEETETFYVVSTVGRTLRTISMDKGPAVEP
jgi:hypothetical protein